jgi:hypothetical protein
VSCSSDLDLLNPLDRALIELEREDAAWPPELPQGLRHGRVSATDRREVVRPSWNTIPLREVVREGCVVAVIDSDESDRVVVVQWKRLGTPAEADACFAETYARECTEAQAAFAELPRWMRVGALV